MKLLPLFMLFTAVSCFSQDIVKFKSGNLTEAKVMEITSTEVKYKKFNNLDGPTYTKNLTEIKYVQFENGDKEVFDANTELRGGYTKVPNGDAKQVQANNVATNNDVRVISPPEKDNYSMAEIQKINGIDVYCMSTPMIPYVNAFQGGNLGSDIDLKSLLWGGLSRQDVATKFTKIVSATLKKAEKEGVTFDGIVYTGGTRAIAIKYVADNIPGTVLAKVKKLNNIQIYAFCEPYNRQYRVINEARAKSGGFTSTMTYGIVNSSIDQDLKKMIDRLDGKKKKKIDAVVYTMGKKGVGVKFDGTY